MTNPEMPISIAASAFFFNLVNVSIQAIGIFTLRSIPRTDIKSNIHFWVVNIFNWYVYQYKRSITLFYGSKKKRVQVIIYDAFYINIYLHLTTLVK